MKPKPHTHIHKFGLLPLVVLLVLSACGSQENTPSNHRFEMLGESALPETMQSSPKLVRESYQFAAANPEVLSQIPCYCGCGEMGHTSNHACYISGTAEDGSLIFDEHALGCSICIDITQDTMRLMDEGKPVSDIRAYIDRTYAKYGPSNIP